MDLFSLLLRVCGISLVGCVCLCVIGRLASGFSALLRVAVSLAAFGVLLYLLVEGVAQIRAAASELINNTVAAEAITLMLKALGMALVAKLCADVCRDCGEGGLGGVIEAAGRIAIFLLGLPLFLKILELVSRMLGAVKG